MVFTKKSQITLFMVIGIILIFVLSIVYLLVSDQTQIELQKGTSTIAKDEQDKFRLYSQSCVEDALKEGIFLIGKQGGVIYDHQAAGTKKYLGPPKHHYGEYVLPIIERDKIYDVSYGIEAPVNDEYHPLPPFYPFGSNRLVRNPAVQIDARYTNPFGNYPNSPFTPLCDHNGANGPEKEGMEHFCESYDSRQKFVHNSVQEFLEAYITNKSLECVGKYDFLHSEESEIDNRNANTTVLFTNEKVHAIFNVPVRFDVNKDSDVVVQETKVSFDTRLKLIHEMLTRLIERDTNDIFFDIVYDAGEVVDCKAWPGYTTRCLKEGMNVSKIKNPCKDDALNCPEKGEYDDILVITDHETMIAGKPFVFYTAIRNRPPALDLIYEDDTALGYGYDIIATVGENISINPFGFDPDEDYHLNKGYMHRTYNYYMWKETYDATYNSIYCDNPDYAEDCVDDPSLTEIRLNSVQPRRWSTSYHYNQTLRNASYAPIEQDKGSHRLKVEVCDEEGLCDYQIVRIYVDLPQLIESTNFYPDIPNEFASLEDPYKILFPYIGLPAVPAEYEYSLYDPGGVVVWRDNSTEDFYDIPSGGILGLPMAVPEFPDIGDYNIGFRAFDASGHLIWDSDSLGLNQDLTVTQCLPHGSDDPPYPFADSYTDFLMWDHACCNGDPQDPFASGFGTFKGSSANCFSLTEYGCREDAGFTVFSGVSPPTLSYIDNSNIPTSEQANDVYRRDFVMRCSGTTGNYCGGETFDIRTWEKKCNECQTCGYDEDGPRCIDAGLSGVVCNDSYECSQGEYQQYNSGPGSGYSCQGTCRFGRCEGAINCRCSKGCGGGCDSGEFRWEDNICQICNETIGCEFENKLTTCPAPDISDGFDFSGNIDFDGGTFAINADSVNIGETGNTIEGAAGNYLSTCINSNYCYISGCGNDGYIDTPAVECKSAGESHDGMYCFIDSAPSGCIVDASGVRCTNAKRWPLHTSPDYCYSGCSCDPSASGGWVGCSAAHISSQASYSLSADGNYCRFNLECRDGWKLADTEYKPGTACPAGQAMSCTATGWQCA